MFILHSSKRATAVAGRSKRSGWLIEDNKERPSLPLYVLIPESEYEKHSNIENEFGAIRNYLVELKSKIKISVYICSNEEYEKQKAGDDSRVQPVFEFEITGKNLGGT